MGKTLRVLTAGGLGLWMFTGQVRAQMPVTAPVPVQEPGLSPASLVENPAKPEATRFERALRGAIELAGERLAQQARQVVPGITLELSEPAIARGTKLNNYGFYFDVQAPNITSTMMVLEMMQRRGAPQPVNTASPLVPFNPDQAYTAFVKEAILDTLLDESAILTLAAGEFLTVAVSGIDPRDPNPLNRTNSAKLVMTIRAVDLIDLRQGRINREQAKDRVVQERF